MKISLNKDITTKFVCIGYGSNKAMDQGNKQTLNTISYFVFRVVFTMDH